MNISDMHIWFRQHAQQMGMQNVRAILPEQIDIVINTAITDTVNEILKATVGVSNDRVITDNSKVPQMNALRTLYKVKILDLIGASAATLPFKYNSADYFNGKYLSNDDYNFPDAMYWVDFSLNYCKATSGWTALDVPPVIDTGNTAFTTNFFPVRTIDDSYLSDALNDSLKKNSLRSPLLVIYSDEDSSSIKFEMYIDKFDKATGLLANSLAPYKFRMSYIAKPAKVKYDEDIAGNNVDCDLPEYMQVDVLKKAVDLYRIAVNSSLYSDGQQRQAEQRENYRNNARTD